MLLKIVRIYHNGRFCSRRRNGPLKTLKRRVLGGFVFFLFMGGFVFCLEPVPEKRWIFPGNRIFQCPSFDGRSFAAGVRVCNADSLLNPFFGGRFGSLRLQKGRYDRVRRAGTDPAVGCVRNPLIVCIFPEWAAWIVGSLPERSLFLRENAGKVRCGSPECAGSGENPFLAGQPVLADLFGAAATFCREVAVFDPTFAVGRRIAGRKLPLRAVSVFSDKRLCSYLCRAAVGRRIDGRRCFPQFMEKEIWFYITISSWSAAVMPAARRPRRGSAAARLGSRTLLVTMDMTKLADMSCNPAVGGVAKGQIVREIDALGGQMGRITDLTAVQFRMLNRSKGAAMWSPRAQCDKSRFSAEWRRTLENTPNLYLWQDTAVELLFGQRPAEEGRPQVRGIRTQMGVEFSADCVILTAGTFLAGVMYCGRSRAEGGRAGDSWRWVSKPAG